MRRLKFLYSLIAIEIDKSKSTSFKTKKFFNVIHILYFVCFIHLVFSLFLLEELCLLLFFIFLFISLFQHFFLNIFIILYTQLATKAPKTIFIRQHTAVLLCFHALPNMLSPILIALLCY